jgi:hypothetical protein
MQIVEAMPFLFQLLKALSNKRNQRKEEMVLMLKVTKELGTEIARLCSGATAQSQLSAELLAMLLEIQNGTYRGIRAVSGGWYGGRTAIRSFILPSAFFYFHVFACICLSCTVP